MAAYPSYFERSEIASDAPLLALRDYTHEICKAQVRRRKQTQRTGEGIFLMISLLAIFGFLLISGIRSLLPSSSPSVAYGASVPVTVHSGDTLWGFAERYGSSSTPLANQVETIAAANKIAPDAPLSPGERLNIPVSNPVILAQLQAHREIAMR